jgi:hypothetical protein
VPVRAAECLQFLDQQGVQFQQVVHVILRVGELLRRQWPARPVGTRLPLVDRVPELARDQFGITDLGRQAEQRRGNLRVEDWTRHRTAGGAQDLEVLACRVHVLSRMNSVSSARRCAPRNRSSAAASVELSRTSVA